MIVISVMITQQKLKQVIKFTLQCLIAIYIGLEISEPPNPYIQHIIILLSLYICLKHNIVSKIISSWNRLLKSLGIKYHIGDHW